MAWGAAQIHFAESLVMLCIQPCDVARNKQKKQDNRKTKSFKSNQKTTTEDRYKLKGYKLKWVNNLIV